MKRSQLFYFKGRFWSSFLAILLVGVVLVGCTSPAPSAVPTGATTPAQTNPTSITTGEPSVVPTATTPQPLVVRVNGTGISEEEYAAELQRYQQAIGRELTPEDRQLVLDDLINQTLLAQAAAENGFTLSEAELQARMDQLASQAGSAAAGTTFADWLAANGYREDSFRQSLARAIAAAWMRDQITAQVAETAEQVHTRQILLRSAGEAEQVLAGLQAGGNFDDLAKAADPLTGGDMGWFPRGFLFSSELEEAAFKLEPGQFSAVIQTLAGYHILSLIEKDPQHPLAPQARLVLQEKALQEWIAAKRQESQIEQISP